MSNVYPSTTNFEFAVEQAVAADRARIYKWLHEESGHNGQTHYEGKKCFWCDALRMVDLTDDDGRMIVSNTHCGPFGNSEQLDKP